MKTLDKPWVIGYDVDKKVYRPTRRLRGESKDNAFENLHDCVAACVRKNSENKKLKK